MPFANSLTITYQDFSNYTHLDKGKIAVAYGWWWAASCLNMHAPWQLSKDCDHDKIEGGAFLIAEHGIAVDFQQ